MFSSTILDVAVGMIFTFLAISLASGIIVEGISSIIKWRANTLLAGIKQLVNDGTFTDLAKDLYEHAAINARGPGAAAPQQNKPSYIDANQFANALMDITGISQQIAKAGAGAPPTVQDLKNTVDAKVMVSKNPQINELLNGMIDRTLGNPDRIKLELANWFDLAMDRLSGAYKRRTQLVSFIIAMVLAVTFNVDAVKVGRVLWEQPTVVDKLKLDNKVPDVKTVLPILETTLPIGWPRGHFFAIRTTRTRVGRSLRQLISRRRSLDGCSPPLPPCSEPHFGSTCYRV